MPVPATAHLIVPVTAAAWAEYGYDGLLSLRRRWPGRFSLYGENLPARLTKYAGGSASLLPPVASKVISLAAAYKDGPTVLAGLNVFLGGDLDGVLAKAGDKLVCGTSPSPLPSSAPLKQHGFPPDLFSLNPAKVHEVVRDILATQGRCLDPCFVAGGPRAWASLNSFARLCQDTGACVTDRVDALLPVLNLYYHATPGGVEPLGPPDYQAVDDSWRVARPAVTVAARQSGASLGFKDYDPVAYADERARYEGGLSARGVVRRPILKVGRIVRKAQGL